jgi:hypothetical protein
LFFFLPLGYYGYHYILLTFETEYEIGLVRALRRLDHSSFFFLPLGYYGYHYILLTFETEYEIGLVRALRRLDHSSYLQKFNNTLVLTLFLLPEAQSYSETPFCRSSAGNRRFRWYCERAFLQICSTPL